jgi:excisionase family DNA binding protein
MPTDLLTLAEVRIALRGEVSLQTLRRKIKSGELQAIRPGRRYLVRRVWLDEMINRGSTPWVDRKSTNINSETSGLASEPAAAPGTSCGMTPGRVALSDFQRAQKILRKPNGN